MSRIRGRSPPPAITAERWARLSPLIDVALDLAPEPRRAYLASIAARNEVLGGELARLIDSCTDPDPLLDRAAAARSELLRDLDFAPGPPDDLQASLQAALGATYTLERELDGAGMSRLFVADEPALGRKVVIKVVKPQRLPGLSVERFEREIRVVAALQQANIVPLLAAGSAAGLLYYTMPLVDGRSLHERLEHEGPLPIRDGVNVLRDVARALAYSHARGVVHRDIKPGNVLLSGGTAIVADFGIAMAIDVATASADAGATTHASSVFGTPAYMAPEQAAGEPSTDHRADLYAFGCLAYAVFTGAPPFRGTERREILAAHLHEAPPPIASLRSDVPPGVAALVARCLEKDPAKRPTSALALLAALDAADAAPLSPPTVRGRRRLVRVAVASMAITAVVGVGAYAVARHRTERAAGTSNGSARDLYLVGSELLKRRGSGVAQSTPYFERAIALDSNFAQAHAALATALEFQPYFVGTPPAALRGRAERAARRALALDPTLADAHVALGWAHSHAGAWDTADAEFRQALTLAPSDVPARFAYGRFLINRARPSEALVQFQKAREHDQASSLLSAWISYSFFLTGRTDSALTLSARAVQLDSTLLPTINLGSLVNLAVGDSRVARRLVALAPQAGAMSSAPYIHAKLGDTAAAFHLVDSMAALRQPPWYADVARATVMLAMGDTARALAVLERASSVEGPMWVVYIPVMDPAYDPVRRSPRFAELVRRAGLEPSRVVADRVWRH